MQGLAAFAPRHTCPLCTLVQKYWGLLLAMACLAMYLGTHQEGSISETVSDCDFRAESCTENRRSWKAAGLARLYNACTELGPRGCAMGTQGLDEALTAVSTNPEALHLPYSR